ncbi:hypothetical protein [Deinococcus aerophilus]|uniref:DUF5666 domain-containing protein n=1 Tax=Deinococcus aerophilus TaxID=522488 RepID=A0ABQ2GWL0_9DEIO|nr:hypothetical protein [Deinococcus aerophilus]GGM15666.1 hypothetical protein GCM10010841_25060 [Deinococcus aerophilus]
MNVARLWLLIAGLSGGLSAGANAVQGVPGMSAALSLSPTYGGALVTGRVRVPRNNELTGVWSSVGRARLMKCTPRCGVVSAVPIQGSVILSSDSGYRVVLGGKFRTGQKVSLVLRFREGTVVNVMATVGR